MQPLMELSTQGESDLPAEETNADFNQQGCHAFYADLFSDCHISSIGNFFPLVFWIV